MNIKRSKLVQVMAVSLVVIGLLIAAWPGVAQSTQLRRQPDQMRDSIGIPERASAELRQMAVQSAGSARPTGSNPGPWTLAAFATYQNENTPFEISTANGDGSNLARRTFNSAADSTPSVNRGGTRIVFISARDGNGEVYVMNADGSGQTRLTNTPANEYFPSWSPDGTQILFYSYRDQVNNNGNAEIYVMNANGSNQTRLTNNTAWDGHPAWSPDGAQIVFSSNRNGTYDLFKMSAQGANQTQLTHGAPTAFYPDWSPDGSTIIFNFDPDSDDFLDIATVSANGGSHTPLWHAPYQTDEAGPKWDPSGHYYAFASVAWVYIQGNWYWNTAYVCVRQIDGPIDGSSNWCLTSSGNDWYPDWDSTDVTAPTSQVAGLSQWTTTTAFNVSWSGSDNSSGVASYDIQIQYRDGANGAWIDWLSRTTQTSATFNGTNGHTYYFRSRARDYANNLEAYPDGNGDAYTTVDTVAPASSASAPLYAASLQIPVTWNGIDPVSGVASYDIQVREGAGAWTDWLINTTVTSGIYPGQLGRTYYFQSRARDKVGNLEAYPDGDGDTLSHAPLYAISGQIKGNRAQPIAIAQAQTNPAALNAAVSDHTGEFTLYFNLSGTVTLTATRLGFGGLPAMTNVIVSDTSSYPLFYLPPLDNQIGDSHFESGNLAAWNANGDLTPTITSTAHTGNYAALLGGTVLTDTLTVGPWHSSIEQTISVSPTIVSGTLSLLYRVDAVEPLSDTLNAYLVGANSGLTFTLPVTTVGWTHAWFDASAWNEPTATLKIDFAIGDVGREARIIFDEVTWGSAITGSHAVFLPLVRR